MQGHPEVAEQSLGSGITVLWGLGHDPGTRTGGICWKEGKGVGLFEVSHRGRREGDRSECRRDELPRERERAKARETEKVF